MQLDCPHCTASVEIDEAERPETVTCPSCGCDILLPDVDTASFATGKTFRTLGRYQLRRWVGRGKFGDVWMAYDTTLERFVAIKIPRAEEMDAQEARFLLREA